MDNLRKRVLHPVGAIGVRAVQEFKEECDINSITRRLAAGMQPTFLTNAVPRFGDFSSVPSLAEANAVIVKAREAFMKLPAAAREELGNDFTRINSVGRDFYERHGLLVKASEAPAGSSEDGVEGGTPRSSVKKRSKAVKAAVVAESEDSAQD